MISIQINSPSRAIGDGKNPENFTFGTSFKPGIYRFLGNFYTGVTAGTSPSYANGEFLVILNLQVGNSAYYLRGSLGFMNTGVYGTDYLKSVIFDPEVLIPYDVNNVTAVLYPPSVLEPTLKNSDTLTGVLIREF